jgi:hypothetical protein
LTRELGQKRALFVREPDDQERMIPADWTSGPRPGFSQATQMEIVHRAMVDDEGLRKFGLVQGIRVVTVLSGGKDRTILGKEIRVDYRWKKGKRPIGPGDWDVFRQQNRLRPG